MQCGRGSVRVQLLNSHPPPQKKLSPSLVVADIQVSIGWRSNWEYIYDVMCNEDFTLNDM